MVLFAPLCKAGLWASKNAPTAPGLVVWGQIHELSELADDPAMESHYRSCVYGSFKSVYKMLSELLAHALSTYGGPTLCLARPSPLFISFKAVTISTQGLF